MTKLKKKLKKRNFEKRSKTKTKCFFKKIKSIIKKVRIKN